MVDQFFQIYFCLLSDVLVFAFVFAAFTSPAKAGPLNASAKATANVEMSIFMGFSPLRWTKPPQMNVFCEIAFQEHPILSRVELVALISRWLGSEGIGKQAETFGFVAFRTVP